MAIVSNFPQQDKEIINEQVLEEKKSVKYT